MVRTGKKKRSLKPAVRTGISYSFEHSSQQLLQLPAIKNTTLNVNRNVKKRTIIQTSKISVQKNVKDIIPAEKCQKYHHNLLHFYWSFCHLSTINDW